MRSVLLVLALLTVGCASRARDLHQFSSPTTVALDPAPAAALAFAPPAALDAPAPVLDRSERTPAAFVGYESARVQTLYVRYDDVFRDGSPYGRGRFGGRGYGRYGFHGPSRFERRAVIEERATLVR